MYKRQVPLIRGDTKRVAKTVWWVSGFSIPIKRTEFADETDKVSNFFLIIFFKMEFYCVIWLRMNCIVRCNDTIEKSTAWLVRN